VRFASHLAPPFTDAEDERYFWRRRAQSEEGAETHDSFFKLWMLFFCVIIIFIAAILILYFILKEGYGK
jgi:ABC-type phosphate transport system permease subunit